MGCDIRRGFGGIRLRALLVGLWIALVVAALLGGCGRVETVASTAQAAAGTAQAAAGTALATSVPAGAGATAQAFAGTVVSGAPGAIATAAAAAATVAPTIEAGARGLLPTAQAFATQAAGTTGGPEATITGKVTKVEITARTFTVQATDGTNYDFIATTGSQVDFTTLATNLVTKQEVTVTYLNTTAPFEVRSVK